MAKKNFDDLNTASGDYPRADTQTEQRHTTHSGNCRAGKRAGQDTRA